MVLLFGTNLAGTRLNLRLVQQRRQIQILILPVALLCRLGQQYLGTADHLVDSAEAEHRHIFTNLLRNEVHEVDNIFRLAVEIFAQLRILRCYAHRAGIKIAYTHHDAADSYQRCCCKAKFFRTQQSGDNNIASCHQLTVCFQCYTVTQIIQQQRLVCFHKSQLPRQSGMIDGSTRRSTGTAVITADKYNISAGLNYAGSNRTDADLAYQLDADAGTGISILQVVNQLSQIFNGIDIMMRRRRNQTNACRCTAAFGNPGINLAARKLSAFTRLSTLCNFNLNFVRIDKVIAGYAKTAAGNLLNCATLAVTIRQRCKTVGILAAFAGIALTTDTVHGNSQAFMCLLAQRAVAHSTCLKTMANAFYRFYLIDIHRQTLRCKGQHTAQILIGKGTAAQLLAELLKELVITCLAGLLQLNNRFRIKHMLLAAVTPLIMRT